MYSIHSALHAITLSVVIVTARIALAPTTILGSCHDDLDHLRIAASESTEAAEDAKAKEDDLDHCRRDPEMYDLMGDRCRSKGRDYESALNNLESKMDDVDDKLRSVQDSCDYQFTINRLTSLEASQRRVDASRRRLCVSYHHLMDSGMPVDVALRLCQTNGDAQWCRQCLGSK